MTQSALSLSNTPGGTKAPKSLLSVVSTILRRRGGTLIGIPDNALGEGNPNLLSSPEFAGGLADAPTRTGLVALSSIAGYDNALAFGHDGSTLTLAYKNFTPVVGLTYTVSATVKMDDGLAPTFASPPSASSANTFAFVFANDPYLPTIVAANSDGTYRVSATVAAPSTLSGLGVIKYPANNNRTFKVTGYKLELGSVATPYTPQSVLRQRGTYQDSAGTMALSTVGEVLGLLTDRLGTVGPELNPDTGFANPAGWSVSGSDATHIVTFSGGTVRYQSGSTSPSMTVSAPAGVFPPGTYEVTATCSNWVSGSIKVFESASGRLVVDRAGTVRTILTTTIDLPLIFYRNSENVDLTLSFLGIKRITGNHATQPTPAQKPTLVRVPKRLGPNLVVNGTFDSGTTGWSGATYGGTLSASGGELVVVRQGANGRAVTQIAATVGKSYQVSGSVKKTAGTTNADLAYAQNDFGGTITVIGSTANSTLTYFSAVMTAAVPVFAVTVGGNGGASGDTFGADNIEVREVLEWTNAISFNGSGQSLITPIATGNEGWLCAAVTFGGAAGVNETIFANGAGAAAQKGVWLTRNGQGGGEDYFRMGVGNGTELAMVTTIFPRLRGTPRVVEGGWTASSVFVGVDGNISSTTRTGDATPAPNPSLIGAYLPTTHVLNGPMTAFLHCQTVPTEAERGIIRKWMSSTNRAPYWGELPTLSLDFASGVYVVSNGEI